MKKILVSTICLGIMACTPGQQGSSHPNITVLDQAISNKFPDALKGFKDSSDGKFFSASAYYEDTPDSILRYTRTEEHNAASAKGAALADCEKARAGTSKPCKLLFVSVAPTGRKVNGNDVSATAWKYYDQKYYSSELAHFALAIADGLGGATGYADSSDLAQAKALALKECNGARANAKKDNPAFGTQQCRLIYTR